MTEEGEDECWEWIGGKFNTGYGEFHYQGRPQVATRVLMEESLGRTLSSSEFVCHTCDNPSCVNPGHLYVGSAAENTRDRVNRGRSANVNGSKNPMSKLTEGDIRNIRDLLGSGEKGYMVADKYNVSKATISLIKNEKRWSCV